MPWVGSLKYVEMVSSIAALGAELKGEIARREKAELELERLQMDFRALAQKAGPSRVKAEFDKDPFAEDERLPIVFLSPDPETELGINLRPEFMSPPDGKDEAGDVD